MRLRLSGTDYFHQVLHRVIVDHGGAGNLGQIRIRLSTSPDAGLLARAWRSAGEQAWTLGAHLRASLRGPHWIVRGPARLELEHGGSLDRLAVEHLRDGLPERGPRARLGCSMGSQPGIVLTWDHRLSDARGAMGLVSSLPSLADGGRLRDAWWRPGHRDMPGMPATAAARGLLARGAIDHLRPHRLARLWRPAAPPANPAAPLAHVSMVLDTVETARVTGRQLAASGRMSETPFLLACLAAGLEDLGGIGGDVLFPLAVDCRPRLGAPIIANCHSFIFLRVPAGLASRDLGEASRFLKDAYRAWVAADMTTKMSASLGFFPYIGVRMARAQLGYFKAGVAASCLVANTGPTVLPDSLFGIDVLGVDHVAAVPGMPGLAALFHRDRRGLGVDLIAAGDAARAVPPPALAQRLRHHLLERAFAGAPA